MKKQATESIMKSIVVKTTYKEFAFTKQADKTWLMEEWREVRCFRAGCYRTAVIKPVVLSKDEVKAQLLAIKQTLKNQVQWVKTK